MEMVRKTERNELKVTQNTNIKVVEGKNDKKEVFCKKPIRTSLRRENSSSNKTALVKIDSSSSVVKKEQLSQGTFTNACGTQTEVSMVSVQYTEEEKLEDMFSGELSVNYLLTQLNRLEESYSSLLEESFQLDITIDELNDSIADVRKEMEAAVEIFNEAMLDEEESEADQE